MAGYDPSAYFPEGAEYNPLRRDVAPTPEPEDDFTNDMLERMEAMGLQDTNFQMDLGNYTRPPAEPDENYVPPATFEEAEASLSAAEQNLQKYQQQLEDFARETQSLVPTDRASAREIKRRAEMIAKGRKDIEISMADVAAARAQITAGKQAATEDPSWWQSTLGYAGETLGVIGKILERTPLLGLGETLVGLASYPAEALSKLAGSQLGQFGDQDNATTALALTPPGLAAAAAGPWAESPIRERGRQFASAVGKGLGTLEDVVLDTPVMREIWRSVNILQPVQNLMEGVAPYFGGDASDARALKWQIGFEAATDPLNIVDFGGAKFTKLGRLRELADVNRGTLELATLRKTLEEMPELAAKVPKGFDGSTLVNDLRAAGIDGESATAMSVAFDQLRAKNAKELRDLASLDPQGWAKVVRPYIEGAEGAGKARQLEVLDQIADFGDDVDPILGRTFREQAELGQRLKVWDAMFRRFGDKPWFRAPGKIWSQLTGESILHDIADKPELLELYFANRAFKADAGAEIMRYQQDVAERAAKYLNDLNPEQVAQVQEALPNLVENPIYRNMLRQGAVPADLPGALQSAAIDLADLYDESAETLRAIQNRFGLKVADLDAQMGYFGREFSDELKQWLLENPNARAFLFADTTRRSKDNLSTAFLPEERARKFREQDFTESENILREKFRAMGLPDNIPVWSRDAFGNLIERAARARQKAEIRNLYGHFVEAYGETDDAIVAGMRGLIDAEKAISIDRAATAFRKAENDLAKAESMQARFREGREALHKAGAAQSTKAEGAVSAANKVADVVRGQKELRASLKVERDLRKMFPGAEGIADDAEDAMRNMAEAVARRVDKSPPPAPRQAAFVEISDEQIDAAVANGRIPVRRMEGYVKIADAAKAQRLNAAQGTYYYFDPKASEYLPAGRVLQAQDKLDAVVMMGGEAEAARILGVTKEALPDLVGKARFSKEFNVLIRQMAEREGYDAVLLRSVASGPGGRATTEVIDLMPRDYSVARVVDAAGRPAAPSLQARGAVDRAVLTSVQSARAAVRKSLPMLAPEAVRKWFPWATFTPREESAMVALQDLMRLLDAVDFGVDHKWLEREALALLEQSNLDAQTYHMARSAVRRVTSAAKAVTAHSRQLVDPQEVARIWRKVVAESGDPTQARALVATLVDAHPQLGTFAAKARVGQPHTEAVARFYDNYQKAATAGDYRAAVRQFYDDLRAVVSPDIAREYTKLADDAIKQLDRLETAQAAVAKPVAGAVNQTVRDARKAYDTAAARAANSNPDSWSAEQKAKWLEGKIGQPPAGSVNGLEVMRRANIKLPNDWDELARIAASNFSPDQADEFAKLAKGLYWQHLDQPSKLYKGLSEIKAWFQKAVLARPGSVAKDVQGSMINGLMSGNTKYLDRARRELGSLSDWASGKGKSSDLVNRLRGAGVLRTQVDEALQRQSFLETEFPGMVGRAAGRVTKLGIVGGTIKSVTEGLRKAGKAVGLDLKEGKSLAEVTAKATDKMLDARVYFEEVNRVATALKALQEGKSFEGAVQEVFKWWGKFDELSRLDRKVLSQIMFFWAWWARSIPITVRHILTHPVRSRWLMTMMAGDADNDERAPNWLRRMGAWALGKSENGQYKAISLGGSSYFSPTMSMLQGNFVNQAMQGKPMQAASGALMDLLRATPPYIQAIPELAMQHDLFTNKPWWRDKNAKTGSNAKAPTALWWFYSDPSDTSFGSGARSAVSEFFGLKANQTRTGTPYLTMDPMKSWMFGLIPGAEPAMTDVSAFFTAPETGAGPKVDVVKGGMRQLGLPIYNVTVDTAKSDIYEAKQALMQDADKLAGGSLYAENGQIRPNNRTYRGQEIASFLDRAEKQARAQGMSATDAKALAMKKMEAAYPSEWRTLTLYQRLEAWEDYLIRLEKGESEVDKQLASAIMLTARRGDYNRVARDAAKQDKKRLDSIMPKVR